MRIKRLLLMIAIGSSAFATADEFEQPAKAHELSNMTLTDTSGAAHAPFSDDATKAVALVFASTDCPIANSLQPTIGKFATEYASRGVRCFMVYSTSGLNAERIDQHVKDYQIPMPAIHDETQTVGRLVDAKVTPEAILIDRTGTIRYRGLINNLYAGYGKKRSTVSKHYLQEAADAVLDEKPVAQSFTKPVGCFISYRKASRGYDPAESSGPVTEFESEFSYGQRTVPLKFYLPKTTATAPVILLSHGLGGSRDVGGYLGRHWAGRGYAVVAMQHAGSDIDIIKNARGGLRQKFGALKEAANPKAAQDRYRDVRETLDHLAKLNASGDFAGRFDLSKVGMSGHSFGAITTQAVSGQNYGPTGQTFTDERIKAAMPMSPSPPGFGPAENAFGKVSIPWLLMTGTQDNSPIGKRTDPKSRREVFKALPQAGHHYELCLEGAEHNAFSDHRSARNRKANPAHHPAIQAISSAFWDTYLKGDVAAKAWLNGSGPEGVLAPQDQWQMK